MNPLLSLFHYPALVYLFMGSFDFINDGILLVAKQDGYEMGLQLELNKLSFSYQKTWCVRHCAQLIPDGCELGRALFRVVLE